MGGGELSYCYAELDSPYLTESHCKGVDRTHLIETDEVFAIIEATKEKLSEFAETLRANQDSTATDAESEQAQEANRQTASEPVEQPPIRFKNGYGQGWWSQSTIQPEHTHAPQQRGVRLSRRCFSMHQQSARCLSARPLC